MILTRTKYGYNIVIEETVVNSRFDFCLRDVNILNADLREQEKALLSELKAQKDPLIYEFIQLATEMESVFKANDFYKITHFTDWEGKDFNEHFHDRMREIEEQLNNIALDFCNRSKHGWTF